MIHSAAGFTQFCKDDSVRESDFHFDRDDRRIGSRCGHLLHTAVEEKFERCLLCDVVVHLDLLQHIVDGWDAEGGPGVEGLMTDKYDVIQSAWHKIRLELEQLVHDLQEDADNEAQWENENLEEA
jgi:hypothetical protein